MGEWMPPARGEFRRGKLIILTGLLTHLLIHLRPVAGGGGGGVARRRRTKRRGKTGGIEGVFRVIGDSEGDEMCRHLPPSYH